MDRRKYIAELVEKTGIRIDEDDPAFVLVLLNRLILQDQKTELEALVGQLVKAGGNIRGETIKQVEERCNATLRQLRGLYHHLPHRRHHRPLPARCPALHQLPDHRTSGGHP